MERYIASLYWADWAVITMITVGYGDIHPVNMYENLFVCIISVFC